jgi:hypothetical protein
MSTTTLDKIVTFTLVIAGLVFGFASLAFLGLFELTRLGIPEQQVVKSIYGNVEWLAPLFLVTSLAIFWVEVRLSELPEKRPFTFVPLDGSWWEYLVFGITSSLRAVKFIQAVVAILLVPVVLPCKLVAYYILGSSSTLIKLTVSIPVVVLSINLLFSIAFFFFINNGRGELLGEEGSLLKLPSGGAGGSVGDLAQLYYFSCLAFLGTGFGEYRPTGYCRLVVLIAVLVGRLLEIVVISVGTSVLVERLATRG